MPGGLPKEHDELGCCELVQERGRKKNKIVRKSEEVEWERQPPPPAGSAPRRVPGLQRAGAAGAPFCMELQDVWPGRHSLQTCF